MVINHIILGMLWIVYCVLHSVLASERVKKVLRGKMTNYKWYRLWYTLFAFVSLFAIIYYQTQISVVRVFRSNNFLFALGMTILLTGLFIMILCIRKYFMNLSGLRSLVIENFSNELQIAGIHKYVRHPLYLGTFLFIWGLFLLLPYLSLLIANIVITVYTLIGIKWEEQKLVAEFGKDYRRYQRSVPKLIPFFFRPKREV